MSAYEWKAVGDRIKAVREAKNVPSQAAMARLVGATTTQFNNWEIGRGQLPVDFAIKICLITGATLDYIYRGDLSSLPANLMTLVAEPETPTPAVRPRSRKNAS